MSVTLQDAPSISGNVRYANPDAKPRGTLIVLMANQNGGPSMSRAVSVDGSFHFPNLRVGIYRPSLRSTDGFFASNISVDGAEFRNGLLDLTDGASPHLQIVASDNVGRVKGFVKRDDKPIAGVLVVLAPVKDSSNAADHRSYLSDSDGSFDLQNIPAGEYYLFATDHGVALEYANPAVDKPYLAKAETIRIDAHQTYEKTLPPSTPVRQAIP